MSKETLTLTEAIKEFSDHQSARKADRLHALFKDGEYIIPVSIEEYPNPQEAVAAFEKGASLPFVVVQHPQVGNYIPIFTQDALAAQAKMPPNTINVKVDFPGLVRVLQQAGPSITTIIFDPDYSGLMFLREKFLKYSRDLLESEKKEQKKIAQSKPEGEIKSTLNALEALDKNTIRQLKKELRRDSRVNAVWLTKNTYDNDVNVWDLALGLNDANDDLVKKISSLISSKLPKRDIVNAVLVADELTDEPLYTR